MGSKRKPGIGFVDWVDRHARSPAANLPLTHIAKGIKAHKIMEAGRIEPRGDGAEMPLAYFFYGRPAFRYKAGAVIKLEATCPFCFLLDGRLLDRARAIFPFDTGAFEERMYNHVLDEDFSIDDFCLGTDADRPEKLIRAAYFDRRDYLKGNRLGVHDPVEAAKPYELEARAYLELIRSAGRNEPDDRIFSIEVQFADPVPLDDTLIAVIGPHTHWLEQDRSPLLQACRDRGAQILTYEFIPGRPLEHYQAHLERIIGEFCADRLDLDAG